MNIRRRLQEDDAYRKKNRRAATINSKRRLSSNETYRQKKNKGNRTNMKKRWYTDINFREEKRQKSRENKHSVGHRKQLFLPRVQKTGKQQTLTAQQKYWRRRARLLATDKERRIDHFLKQKMTQQSAVPAFDADLIFNKANALERKATRKQKIHHATLVQQWKTALKSTKCTSEADIEAVFGQRLHTRSPEAYYWEQTYLMIDCSEVIPIDRIGLAHLFPPAKSQLAAEETQNKTDSSQTETPSTAQPKKTPRWSFSNSLCRINHQSIVGTNDLLQKLHNNTNQMPSPVPEHQQVPLHRQKSRQTWPFLVMFH